MGGYHVCEPPPSWHGYRRRDFQVPPLQNVVADKREAAMLEPGHIRPVKRARWTTDLWAHEDLDGGVLTNSPPSHSLGKLL